MDNRQTYKQPFDEIRHLIARWYDGVTTASEEERIISFFASSDSSQLPDDLASEAKIFAAMAVMPKISDEQIELAVDEAIDRGKRRRRMLMVRRFSLGAAAAAMVGVLIWGVTASDISIETPMSNGNNMAMDNTAGHSVEHVADTIMVDSYVKDKSIKSDIIAMAAPSPASEPSPAQAPASAPAPAVDRYDGYEVLTPEEAAAVLNDVFSQYSRTVTATMRDVDNNVRYSSQNAKYSLTSAIRSAEYNLRSAASKTNVAIKQIKL